MSPKNLPFDVLVRRDGGSGSAQTDNLDSDWWWTSPAAYAIKWGIIAGIFVFFLLFFFGSYLHAKRRMKKGVAPLGYHRWLITRRQRAQFEPPPQNNVSFYRAQDGYAMHGYAPPPPAYNPDGDNVPAYTPPEGASKVNPAQNYAEIPPPGPPPSHSEEGPSQKGPVVTVTPPEASSSLDPR